MDKLGSLLECAEQLTCRIWHLSLEDATMPGDRSETGIRGISSVRLFLVILPLWKASLWSLCNGEALDDGFKESSCCHPIRDVNELQRTNKSDPSVSGCTDLDSVDGDGRLDESVQESLLAPLKDGQRG